MSARAVPVVRPSPVCRQNERPGAPWIRGPVDCAARSGAVQETAPMKTPLPIPPRREGRRLSFDAPGSRPRRRARSAPNEALHPVVSPSVEALWAERPFVALLLRSLRVPARDRADLLQTVLLGAWEAIRVCRYRPDPLRHPRRAPRGPSRGPPRSGRAPEPRRLGTSARHEPQFRRQPAALRQEGAGREARLTEAAVR